MTATTEDIRRKGVLEEVELQLVSKEPQISPDDAQIASPNNPVFRRLDVMTSTLQNANEVMNIEQLQYQIEKIQDYIPFLYTYRSLSQAINRSDSLKMTSPEIQKEMNDLYFNIYKPKLDKVLDVVKKELYTGHIGDGKIFVSDVTNIIRVRTGEEDSEALR